jgi:hypothetical protein
MDELVDPYQVASSIELENQSFRLTKNTYVDVNVDVDELNVISNTNIHREVNGDNKINLEFNEEYDVRHDDE